MMLTKVLLFGPHSIKPTPGTSKKTMDQIWDVKSTTPGLIAFVAVFARFLFSPDKDFNKVGKIIKYTSDFDKYKKNLIISANNAHIQKTFTLWNTYLFGTKAAPKRAGDDSDTDEMLRAIDGMDSDSGDDTVPIICAAETPEFTPTPVASAAGTPQLTPTPLASTTVSRQPTPTPTHPSTATVNFDTEYEAPPRTKRGGKANGPKVVKGGGRGRGSSTVAGSGAGNGAGPGRGHGRGRGGKGKAQAEEIATDEEEEPAPPTNCRLTRQGASQKLITVSCGDKEEESD
ncbi:hypothetical protein AAF712_015949 [Marasmius tenuissimus]|uniref:Uncharacterized protein n=1 Tax=Marasmius tenuissimus TaxID=585030 RepID=A0ABR2Z802_9AGAR